jgi:ArsR family transcriptional regulator
VVIFSNRPVALIADYLLALADATRLRILVALRDQERSVADIAAEVRISRDRASRQLAHLRHSGIVASRREHRTVLFSLANSDSFAICEAVCSGLGESAASEWETARLGRTGAGPVGRFG